MKVKPTLKKTEANRCADREFDKFFNRRMAIKKQTPSAISGSKESLSGLLRCLVEISNLLLFLSISIVSACSIDCHLMIVEYSYAGMPSTTTILSPMLMSIFVCTPSMSKLETSHSPALFSVTLIPR
jgi:hypothetical protein